ncbi:MAG: hypothetical protein JXQ83_02010, partial [Candidatus Glassbacteria bacterium]|nr:hypothetical protein [Candidatus Glassbacteria bacterium]
MLSRNVLIFCSMAFCIIFSGCVRETAEVWEDFSDGDFAGWTTDKVSAWEVADGVLQQKNQVDTTGDWLGYFARMEDARVHGDFDLHVSAGFNLKAYPMKGENRLEGSIYYRSMAFGI